jgi:hypothetical protein
MLRLYQGCNTEMEEEAALAMDDQVRYSRSFKALLKLY